MRSKATSSHLFADFSLKHGNISFPPVKLTSVVVTCLVLSPFWRPYWCKNRTVGRSRRHLVDFLAIVGNANPPRFSSKIAKVRSCCLHLCSISLRMCPTSSKIDQSGRLMCPKKASESPKTTRTPVVSLGVKLASRTAPDVNSLSLLRLCDHCGPCKLVAKMCLNCSGVVLWRLVGLDFCLMCPVASVSADDVL